MTINLKPKNIFLLILVALFVVIVLQNTHVVSVQVLFWQFSMSRAILYPLIFAIGVLFGMTWRYWRKG